MIIGKAKMYLGDMLIVSDESSDSPSTPTDTSSPVYKTIDGQLYRQVLCDDFDGTDIDANLWSADYLAQKYSPAYTAKSIVKVKDSICHIISDPQNGYVGGTSWKANCSGINSANYYDTSAQNKCLPWYGFIAQEGYFEVKMKLPAPNTGIGAGWWMTGAETGSNDEIDIIEQFATDTQSAIWPANYYNDYLGQASGSNVVKHDSYTHNVVLANAFHVYGFKWDSNGMQFFLDDVKVMDWNDLSILPVHPMLTFFTLYMNMDKIPANCPVEELQIDWFKIYKACDTQMESHPTITGYDPINVTATAGESVNNYTGRFGNLPYYVRVNWSDGSKTEHPVRWERIHGSSKATILASGGSFELNGVAQGVGIDVVASVVVS